MTLDDYPLRVGKIRNRFSANLIRELDSLDDALPQITGGTSDAVEAIAAAYRRVLELCSTGPAVGFIATGDAARSVANVLSPSLHAKRALNEAEVASVRDGLRALRAAAKAELNCNSPSG
jgi:hypothetical protein